MPDADVAVQPHLLVERFPRRQVFGMRVFRVRFQCFERLPVLYHHRRPAEPLLVVAEPEFRPGVELFEHARHR